ncbi:MAG: DNA translocase FtsK [Bacteroidales bacterium]|nr:DNA translocase FtsK [Bacteroidales bacterium]
MSNKLEKVTISEIIEAFKYHIKDERFRFVSAVILILLSFYLFLSFISYFFTWKEDQSFILESFSSYLLNSHLVSKNWAGKLGAYLSHVFIHNLFGISSLCIPLILLWLGLKLLNIKIFGFKKAILPLIFFAIWFSVLTGFIFGEKYFFIGGAYGVFTSKWLISATGFFGTASLIFIVGIILFVIFFDNLFHKIKNNIKSLFKGELKQVNLPEQSNIDESFSASFNETESKTQQNNSMNAETEQLNNNDIKDETEKEIELIIEHKKNNEEVITKNEEESIISTQKLCEKSIEYDPYMEIPGYKLPSLELLEKSDKEDIEVTEIELKENKDKIVHTLNQYGIQISQIKATIGPTVTLYEIVPAPGIKISKIKNLEDDIALNLSALGIRIIAPMPGKGTIGIEVPNKTPQIVSMYSLLSNKSFIETNYDLPIAIGKTIQNEVFTFDLTKAPHVLIAGATGQGKSVGLNVILTSLLYKKLPTELKLVIIDPKKIEMSDYADLVEHFIALLPDQEEPIINKVEDAKKVLKSLTIEMDNRYSLLKEAGGTRTIKDYNEKIKKGLLDVKKFPYLPYIVVIIDEFADLIMTAGREIEESITRLAQLARAVGIHLIIATQRPSTNIITGTIKANFPTRIAFRVFAMIDSRTILDTPGANQLVGRGDMLISLGGGELKRIQCAFITPSEINNIVKYIMSQPKPSKIYYLPQVTEESSQFSDSSSFAEAGYDDLFAEAARLVVSTQIGSTSLIQRKFSIGYARAGRIMDQLEAAKIVGPPDGSKPRQVLISDLITLEQHLRKFGINT